MFKNPAKMECKNKVTFNKRVKVFYYKKTPIESDIDWMQEARDRLRFKKRILDVERQIQWVFEPFHRSKICNLLFSVNIV